MATTSSASSVCPSTVEPDSSTIRTSVMSRDISSSPALNDFRSPSEEP